MVAVARRIWIRIVVPTILAYKSRLSTLFSTRVSMCVREELAGIASVLAQLIVAFQYACWLACRFQSWHRIGDNLADIGIGRVGARSGRV